MFPVRWEKQMGRNLEEVRGELGMEPVREPPLELGGQSSAPGGPGGLNQHRQLGGIELLEAQSLVGHVHRDAVAAGELARQDAFGDRRLQLALDGALQGAGAVHRVVTHTG